MRTVQLEEFGAIECVHLNALAEAVRNAVDGKLSLAVEVVYAVGELSSYNMYAGNQE